MTNPRKPTRPVTVSPFATLLSGVVVASKAAKRAKATGGSNRPASTGKPARTDAAPFAHLAPGAGSAASRTGADVLADRIVHGSATVDAEPAARPPRDLAARAAAAHAKVNAAPAPPAPGSFAARVAAAVKKAGR